MTMLTRRTFLTASPLATLLPAGQMAPGQAIPDAFPAQAPALVQEMVAVSHGNAGRVAELVKERPALARATWDWGYGDWETALGAASHVGNRQIAEILLASGAHPTIFSAAMLGQLDVVKAFVAASPGIQRTRGPHGITLLSHARAGGAAAAAVLTYLQSLGDADPAYANEPLDERSMAEIAGTYTFGTAARDRLIVSVSPRGALVVKREGSFDRNLFHQGGRVFNPAGAEAVRVRFEPVSGRALSVTIEDGSVILTARR